MLYQLSTTFTLLGHRSGVIENLSPYAVIEYATATSGAVPDADSGIRIMPGGKFRFALSKTTNAFVRFLYVRAGDFSRHIAVVDDVNINMGDIEKPIGEIADSIADGANKIADAIKAHEHECNVTVKCDCNCCCNDSSKEGWEMIVSDTEPTENKRLWFNSGSRNQASADDATHAIFVYDKVTNVVISATEPENQSKYWIKIKK